MLGSVPCLAANPRVNRDEPASSRAFGKLPPGCQSSSPYPTMKPASQVNRSSPSARTGWLASSASRRSQLRTRRPAAEYALSASRSMTLMKPIRPRGMTSVIATLTQTAPTIRKPRTAPVMRTPLMLGLTGAAGRAWRPAAGAHLVQEVVKYPY